MMKKIAMWIGVFVFSFTGFAQVIDVTGEFSVPVVKTLNAGHRKAGRTIVYSLTVKPLVSFWLSGISVRGHFLLCKGARMEKGKSYLLEVQYQQRESWENPDAMEEQWLVRINGESRKQEIIPVVKEDRSSSAGMKIHVKKGRRKNTIVFEELIQGEIINAP